MKIEIVESCVVAGKQAGRGAVMDVEKDVAALLISIRRAKPAADGAALKNGELNYREAKKASEK